MPVQVNFVASSGLLSSWIVRDGHPLPRTGETITLREDGNTYDFFIDRIHWVDEMLVTARVSRP
jgi:hypothetical protein